MVPLSSKTSHSDRLCHRTLNYCDDAKSPLRQTLRNYFRLFISCKINAKQTSRKTPFKTQRIQYTSWYITVTKGVVYTVTYCKLL